MEAVEYKTMMATETMVAIILQHATENIVLCLTWDKPPSQEPRLTGIIDTAGDILAAIANRYVNRHPDYPVSRSEALDYAGMPEFLHDAKNGRTTDKTYLALAERFSRDYGIS